MKPRKKKLLMPDNPTGYVHSGLCRKDYEKVKHAILAGLRLLPDPTAWDKVMQSPRVKIVRPHGTKPPRKRRAK